MPQASGHSADPVSIASGGAAVALAGGGSAGGRPESSTAGTGIARAPPPGDRASDVVVAVSLPIDDGNRHLAGQLM
jgi:hypothetical protein